jgi:hypothetical protein
MSPRDTLFPLSVPGDESHPDFRIVGASAALLCESALPNAVTRAGRELELLVAALEDTIGSLDGIRVESPARLRDLDTDQVREVDVAIRARHGTHELLIVMECRDRAAPGDVTWIEQIRTKCSSVGADRIVAVSASGFTKPALQKAKRYRIETRSMEQVATGEMRKLTGVDLERVKRIHFVRDVKVTCDAAPIPADEWRHSIPPRRSPSDDAIFLNAATGRRFSIRDVLEFPGIREQMQALLAADGETPFQMIFKKSHVATDHGGILQRVVGMSGMIGQREERESIAPARLHRYRSGKAELARRAEFRVDDVTIVATTWPRDADRPGRASE